MLFHFRDKFSQLNSILDKYDEFMKRLEIPAKTILLKEGKTAGNYFYIEKGCVRLYFANNGDDKTVQFFFENEGLSSLESFLNNTPSLFSIETIEPSVIYQLPKKYVNELMDELGNDPGFVKTLLQITATRQMHYIHEFVSFIRDTPEQRYQNLLAERPHIVQRVPQHYIASYLGVSTVHLSRIKSKMSKGKLHF